MNHKGAAMRSMCVLASLAILCVAATAQVSQVHIAYGADVGSMSISWATPAAAPAAVSFGTTPAANDSTVAGTSEHFIQRLNSTSKVHIDCDHCVNMFLHTALLTDLRSGGRYWYRISGDDATYSFRAKNESNVASYTLGVFGDMGTKVKEGFESPTLARLQADAQIDAILHVGDLAYDLMDDGGRNGDRFMLQIQPLASKLPYMVTLGNHEGGTDFAGDLHHYVHRFNMPMKERHNNIYYSFDLGPAHIIAFSSETYFWQLWDTEPQFEWLKADLAAVDREKTPWVITMAHRPMYCSNEDGDDCTKDDANMRFGLPALGHRFFALEPLFKQHHVDLSFWAHEHSYERLWPTFNGTVMNGTTDPANPYHNAGAVTHIVAGAAGCREGHDAYKAPRGPWSAVRNSAYGYGRLRLENRTHIHWEQVDDQTGALVDQLWLVKTSTNAARESPKRADAHEQLRIFEKTRACTIGTARLPGCLLEPAASAATN